MSQENNFIIIFVIDVIIIAFMYAIGNYKKLKRCECLKSIVRNSLEKGYLTEDALEMYVDTVDLKYEKALPILQELIIELEQENYDIAKINYLRQMVLIYQKTGFLSNLLFAIRFKMRALAKQSREMNELVFQLAQDIQLLQFKDKLWKRMVGIISIISGFIAIYQFYPNIIQLF